MEQRFGKGKSPRNHVSPSSSSSTTLTIDVALGPQIPDPSSAPEEYRSPPRLSQKPLPREMMSMISHEAGFVGRNGGVGDDDSVKLVVAVDDNITHTQDVGDQDLSPEKVTLPQHVVLEMKYYRVVYRGVVSLLSRPTLSSSRSGAYVSYGEIIASSAELYAKESTSNTSPATPTRKQQNSIQENCITESSDHAAEGRRKVIRVDKVLTGGYTVDAIDTPVVAGDRTPKRGNTQPNVSIVGPSPLPLSEVAPSASEQQDSQENVEEIHSHGYIFADKKQVPILVQIPEPPKCERGDFLYKVISSTPLAVYAGPSLDAPTTKGMLVPGTVHEVCLRVVQSSVCYLRLTRRRGWVADRRRVPNSAQDSTSTIVMKDVTHQDSTSECISSIISLAASSVATPVPVAQNRHRPPRRRRDVKETIEIAPLPRHIPGPVQQSFPQSRSDSYDCDSQINHSHDRVMSPSSNVSLLSDESSSLEHSVNQRHLGFMTPDRSVARSTASSSVARGTGQPSFFLMRVNAPRGLKILDAPHFQVNNLIHGSHPGGSVISSPSKEVPVKNGNHSIFQTMSGHHSTTLTSKIGNPAVFDSNTKARKLPRGSVFEASKRIEASGAFSQGSGLIKLSDNSGWAIVPKREELDDQYRTSSGALAGIKEGEASRAFEEVGNAIVEDHHSPVYIRILTRVGVVVSLPPASTASDDVTSPSSSAGGSSSVLSGNNGSCHIRSQESDVASSVGSSFLDAMFRTPRRRDPESHSNDTRRDVGNPNPPKAPTIVEKLPFSTLLPCGSYVEAERWASPPEADSATIKSEFARLRGGQGWIPRSLIGKPVTEIISAPETRFGSFWFRVQDRNGIKVRLGPSRRAPSIKSEDGVYFRFECGEFLRASEVVTFFRQSSPSECYAKLYRNRHIRLYAGHGEIRPLSSLTVQAEWVQVFGSQELFLEECAVEPRIERHKQGWRYNVVLDVRIQVRKGPSFEAESNGVVLLGGESVLINERVTGPDDTITWLRLKDGQGWAHTVNADGEALMIPHSLRHRTGPLGRPTKSGRPEQEDIAYNTIIARLFHNDLQDESRSNASQASRSKRRWN
jgi:hypothetical protein